MKVRIGKDVMDCLMGYTNSRALIQIDYHKTPKGYQVHGAKCVEASAASHVAPPYPRSAEAVRVYGEPRISYLREMWREWIEGIIREEVQR